MIHETHEMTRIRVANPVQSINKTHMKILMAYDGSEFAEAAIKSLRYAGLSHIGEALVYTGLKLMTSQSAKRFMSRNTG